MSAQEQTCYTLICDECREHVYDDGEGREVHFESAEALRFDATNYGEWSRDGDRDLCPSCTCAAHSGHLRRVVNGSIFCDRCDEDLALLSTAKPKETYL